MQTSISFDAIAPHYDELWSRSAVGHSQRAAVWRHIDNLFVPGERVLDLGCGTGDDALHLRARGVFVDGVDASQEMVRISRSRGVSVRQLRIEDLRELQGSYDGAISNFGALNCIENLHGAATEMARLVRIGGFVAACWMGRFCLWETVWYLAHANMAKACRRWRYKSWSTSFHMNVFYPSRREIEQAFGRHFRLVGWYGIGLTVPPSYVALPDGVVNALAQIDKLYAHFPGLRGLSDHRLAIFRRAM
jgi:ubiquinone/menaquinone biosynthesis C-methylase UbiE